VQLSSIGCGVNSDPVSPELALVDSTLRARLLEDEAPSLGGPVAAPTVATEVPTRRTRRRGRWAALVVGIAVVAAAGTAWYSLSGSNASAPQGTSARFVPPGVAPSTRTFAWAPVRGVSAYDVEILRAGAIVYSVRTNAPRIQVTAHGGHGTLLTPGEYQWYVWPVLRKGGKSRHGRAIVASTFTITR